MGFGHHKKGLIANVYYAMAEIRELVHVRSHQFGTKRFLYDLYHQFFVYI